MLQVLRINFLMSEKGATNNFLFIEGSYDQPCGFGLQLHYHYEQMALGIYRNKDCTCVYTLYIS